jgi:hypothetical protein
MGADLAQLKEHGSQMKEVMAQLLFQKEGIILEQGAGVANPDPITCKLPILYFWHREESGSYSEIDCIIQHKNQSSTFHRVRFHP